ncbi:putative methyltransferase-like protein [Diplodia seriata]|uniref:Putative methyltransferase-like protein n=1 Tax=Diplodia seriata TaxID=420778 RepID=A0A1S8B3P0_9PEZI|nr:putative methyltransferase-like protein [Diplodia seriata]
MLHGEEDPDLTEIRSTTKDKVDFHDPRAVRQLTASLLRRDFDLTVDLPPDRLCPPVSSALELDQLDFTICNPPFFSSIADWKASISGEGKDKGPNSVCTGAEVEMVTEGGDLGFVLRMVEESCVHKEKVAWYTSMLGKLSSTIKLVEKLRELGCRNWAVCCLGAQHKTRRWAVGWSWRDLRPRTEIARRDMNIKHILPLPTDYKLPISDVPMERFTKAINETMHNLALQWKWNEELRLGYGRATKNVWSRSARRKRKREEGAKQPTSNKGAELKDESDSEIALGFEISVQTDVLLIRWVQGQEQVLFESFCGMMKQTLQPMLAKPQKERNIKEEQ